MRATFITLLGLVAALAGEARAHRPIVPTTGYDLELVCDGSRCDEVNSGGTRWVVGEHGQRYTVAIVNRTDVWVEAVVAVDGRSVLDGRRVGASSRGYLVAPHDRVEIEGWRVSSADVATFRFTSIGDSYVGRIGDPSQAGQVRVDFYPERAPVWIAPPELPVEPWRGYPDDGGRDERPAPADEAHAGDAPRSSAEGSAARWHDFDGERQDLGTQYGERRSQPVAERSFERADPHHAARSLTIRYDDRAGLIARGIIRPRWSDDRRWVPSPPRDPWFDDAPHRWVPPPERRYEE